MLFSIVAYSEKMSVRKRGKSTEKSNGQIDALKHIQDVKTDPTRWRLRNVHGEQTWHYLESDEELKAWPITTADKYYMGLDTVSEL